MSETLRTSGEEQIEAFVQRTRDKFGDSLSDEFMAELVISYVFRRDRYNETHEHYHGCTTCGRMVRCVLTECEVSADFGGRDFDCGE